MFYQLGLLVELFTFREILCLLHSNQMFLCVDFSLLWIFHWYISWEVCLVVLALDDLVFEFYEYKLLVLYDFFYFIVVSSRKDMKILCEYRMFDSVLLHLFLVTCECFHHEWWVLNVIFSLRFTLCPLDWVFSWWLDHIFCWYTYSLYTCCLLILRQILDVW